MLKPPWPHEKHVLDFGHLPAWNVLHSTQYPTTHLLSRPRATAAGCSLAAYSKAVGPSSPVFRLVRAKFLTNATMVR